MKHVSLPLVTHDVSLQTARQRMRAAGRSGIVWRKSGDEYILYAASAVVFALASGKARLHEAQGEPIEPDEITEESARAGEPAPAPFGESVMYRQGPGAPSSTGSPSEARLALSDVRLAAALEPAPEDCYCEQCERAAPNGECPVGHPRVRCC